RSRGGTIQVDSRRLVARRDVDGEDLRVGKWWRTLIDQDYYDPKCADLPRGGSPTKNPLGGNRRTGWGLRWDIGIEQEPKRIACCDTLGIQVNSGAASSEQVERKRLAHRRLLRGNRR